eukprot:4452692-Pleurochrysis_carterae.AAC.1
MQTRTFLVQMILPTTKKAVVVRLPLLRRRSPRHAYTCSGARRQTRARLNAHMYVRTQARTRSRAASAERMCAADMKLTQQRCGIDVVGCSRERGEEGK